MFRDAHSLPGSAQRGPLRGLVNMVLVLMTVAGLTACGFFSDEPDQPAHWSPFHSQSNWQTPNGAIHVSLTGFERGHEPGRASEFNLVVENRTDGAISAPICIYLVDEYAIVQSFGEMEVNLEPGVAGVRPFFADFNADLAPRAYGLAILIEGYGAVVHTVRLGIADDEARPWLDASQLTCDS